MSFSPALFLVALRPGWPPGFSPPDGMLTDWMGALGRRWGAPVTWFTGRAAGVAGRRLAVVPRHYNRSFTSGSEESAQAHITSSPSSYSTSPPPLPVQLNNTLPFASVLVLLHHTEALWGGKAERLATIVAVWWGPLIWGKDIKMCIQTQIPLI